MRFNNKFDLDNYLKQNTSSYLAGGRKSNIFLMDNTRCLKLFNKFVYSDDVVKLIREMNLNGFYEIYDLLYDKDKNFIGYIMKYYEDNNIDILTLPVDYTIDNYNSLYEDVLKLTDNNVLLGDLCRENIILTRDKLIVIDADEYKRIDNIDKYVLENDNLFSLESLFNSIYLNARNIYHPNENINMNKINDLFCTSSPQRILKKYKYPIDYLKENNYDNK